MRFTRPFSLCCVLFAACTPEAETPADSDPGVDTAETGDTADTADTSIDTGDSGTGADYVATSGGTMIFISAATFSMGSGMGDPGEDYIDHDVTLTHDFYLGQTEVTRGEWEANPASAGWAYRSVADGYPCTGTLADCPADTLSWYDAAKYVNWLSGEEGLDRCYLADGTDLAAAYLTDPYACTGYRLPTEAEWEYAARAGENTTYAGSNTAADVAWTYENAYSMGTNAHEGCSLSANAWGSCDMSGNVWEWTNDWDDAGHGGYADGSSDVDPAGPATGSAEGYEGSSRVIRGGGWSHNASYATVATRGSGTPSGAGNSFGFRLARSIP